MIPRSFDAVTAREAVGDERARVIEAKARADADKGREGYKPPVYDESGSYWSACQGEFERAVYRAQFSKRLARNERRAAQATS
jgi:hypothetical protein